MRPGPGGRETSCAARTPRSSSCCAARWPTQGGGRARRGRCGRGGGRGPAARPKQADRVVERLTIIIENGVAKERQKGVAMPTARTRPITSDDPVSQFFASLAKPGHQATLARKPVSLRFDVVAGAEVQRWHLSVAKDEVSVSRETLPADAGVRVERPYFEQRVTGP